MRKTTLVAALVAGLLTGTSAVAAGQTDMIIMRKAIKNAPGAANGQTTPTPTPRATGKPSYSYYSWQVSPWIEQGSCGQQGSESRTVSCVQTDGTTVDDALCTGNGSGPRPIDHDAVVATQSCTYGWQAGEWSTGTATCGASTITRDVTCLRSDGTVVDGASCSGSARPASSGSVTDYTGCAFDWNAGAWSQPSTTCGQATETRPVACRRSDGTDVADASCVNAGTKPPASQSLTMTSGCTTYWATGAWGATVPACGPSVQNRTVSCVNQAGATLDDGQCNDPKPAATRSVSSTATCSYAWTPGQWSAQTTTCGDSAETRTVVCSDGTQTVDDANCVQARPATSRTEHVVTGCTTMWQTGAYGAPMPSCGATSQVRAVSCQRSDGQTVANSACDPSTQPAASQAATDYSACSFSWTATPWSAWSTMCGQATSTRTVSCQRSDGSDAGDASCTGTRPDATQTAYQTSGCGYQWTSGPWSAAAPACGASSQTREVDCVRSDGQIVDPSSCAPLGAAPAASQPANDYSTCGYDWSAGDWSQPTSTCGQSTETRTVTCQRSDGTGVADSNCTGTKPDASQSVTVTTGCGYAWKTTDWATPKACGSTTQTRTAYCQRTDGTTVDNAYCTDTPPVTSQTTTDYGSCTYSWYVSDWSQAGLCGKSATQTRTVKCLRSSASTDYVDDSYCTSGGAGAKPAASQTVTDYSGCSYTATYGSWGSCTAVSGASDANVGSQSRSVTCTRSDKTVVDASYCGTTNPQTQQCPITSNLTMLAWTGLSTSYAYYPSDAQNDTIMTTVEAKTPNITRTVASATANYSKTDIGNYTAVEFVGTFVAPISGPYTFVIDGDDSARIYVDGSLIVEDAFNWNGSTPRVKDTATIQLSAGRHSYKGFTYQMSGGQNYVATITGPSGSYFTP